MVILSSGSRLPCLMGHRGVPFLGFGRISVRGGMSKTTADTTEAGRCCQGSHFVDFVSMFVLGVNDKGTHWR